MKVLSPQNVASSSQSGTKLGRSLDVFHSSFACMNLLKVPKKLSFRDFGMNFVLFSFPNFCVGVYFCGRSLTVLVKNFYLAFFTYLFFGCFFVALVGVVNVVCVCGRSSRGRCTKTGAKFCLSVCSDSLEVQSLRLFR